MRVQQSREFGFTLIELLTVIAIISVLAAIIFPLAGTVREQARQSDCQTKLHQMYVAARVYKEDEGAFPPALMGYAETSTTDPGCGDPSVPRHVPFTGTGSYVNPDELINGFLYREQIRDMATFSCPNSPAGGSTAVTVAYYPNTQTADPNQPYYWDAAWIGDFLKTQGCPSDGYGTIDCFWDVSPADPCLGGAYLQPRFFYVSNSYDIGPRIGEDGRPVTGPNGLIYDRHYSPDWTGVKGLSDLPNQLKYANPPSDTTLLTYCSWHQATANTGTVIAISLAGTARKIDFRRALRYGPNMFAQ